MDWIIVLITSFASALETECWEVWQLYCSLLKLLPDAVSVPEAMDLEVLGEYKAVIRALS